MYFQKLYNLFKDLPARREDFVTYIDVKIII